MGSINGTWKVMFTFDRHLVGYEGNVLEEWFKCLAIDGVGCYRAVTVFLLGNNC